MDVLLNPASTPFLVSLYILAGLVALELLLFILGADAFHFIDDLLPDIGETDAPEALTFSKALSFIGVGKVPVIMILMSFLALFGLAGFFIQNAAFSLFGVFSPLALAIPVAALAALSATGQVAKLLARILPTEQTSAVTEESLFGRIATIVWGDATFTRPAKARVIDAHGYTHFIQLKASSPEEIYIEGQTAMIASKLNGFYIGTSVPESSK